MSAIRRTNAFKKNGTAMITLALGLSYFIVMLLPYVSIRYDFIYSQFTGFDALDGIDVLGGPWLAFSMDEVTTVASVLVLFSLYTLVKNIFLPKLPGRIGYLTLDEVCRLLVTIYMISTIVIFFQVLIVTFNSSLHDITVAFSLEYGAYFNPSLAIMAAITFKVLDNYNVFAVDLKDNSGFFDCPVCRARITSDSVFCPKCSNRVGK